MNKKRILGGIIMTAIVAAVAFNFNMSENKSELSALSLANIEALAEGDKADDEWGCGGESTYIPNETLRSKTCIIFISSKLICKTQNKVCCDPSKQTSCSGHNPGVEGVNIGGN